MLRLLKIDLYKLFRYRTFWVITIMYSLLIMLIPASVMEFLKWLKASKGAELFTDFDPLKVPVLYFPDIWQNITYVFVFFKIFIAILVIISISNEFSYKTIRQNVIDGLSRWDFIQTKLLSILVICLYSTGLILITGLITGLIYTPEYEFSDIFTGMSFVPAYFLDIFAYSIFAFLVTVMVKRSGLSIAMLILAMPIEYIFTSKIPDSIDYIAQYFPLHAINNLIEVPFPRYAFMEIQDYVSMSAVGVVLLYIALFIWLIHYKLKTSDI